MNLIINLIQALHFQNVTFVKMNLEESNQGSKCLVLQWVAWIIGIN